MATPSTPWSVSAASMSRSKKARDETRSPQDDFMFDEESKSKSTIYSSQSVSRSRMPRTETNSTADEMLRASLLGGDTIPGSPASVSRSRLRDDKKPSDDVTPYASVSRSVLSSASSASVSRSALRGEGRPSVDDTASSTLRGNPIPSASPGSVSRSALRGEKKSPVDDTLRRSFASARGIPADPSSSVFTTPPPLYSSKLSVRPRPTSMTAGRSTIVDSIKLRKAKLQEEIDRANEEAGRRKTDGLYRNACSTDLLFLIDTTSSMYSYIKAAKDQVRSIISDIKKTFLNESEIRVAVVSYKDHSDSPNVEFIDFTSSTDSVLRFLDTLNASGGADAPEDVLGGIQQALRASWNYQTRCIVHIADAPPHGSSNHDLGEYNDYYYHEGSEPHGLTYQPLIKRLIDLKINYALLRITSYTDRMALNWATVYGHSNSKLLPINAHYHEVCGTKAIGWSAKNAVQQISPQFEEQEIGTTYDKLRHLVVQIVTASVSRTAGRLSLALVRYEPPGRAKSMSPLSAISERDDGYSRSKTIGLGSSLTATALETSPPRWDTPGWLDETLEVEGFCPAIVVHSAETLADMMFDDKNIKLSTTELTVYTRSKPFAKGSVRLAYYAGSAASTSRFVVKSFIRGGHTRADVAEDMRMQALCKAFALEFNGLLKVEPPLDFIVTSCLQKRGVEDQNLSLEPFIEGEYLKYNNNAGWIDVDLEHDAFGQMAQAFSHFTFERSWGRFLVNDLQGVGRVFTDPSIQTQDPERFKLNDTNLGEEGFKFFFTTHKCNTYCKQLELESNAEMLVSKKFKFRPRWPTMDPTVCCSNKLCRRIIRLATAHDSDDFSGYHWCDACWPQLQDSMAKSLCAEAGSGSHEFDVSRFFHESQGEATPQKCPDHREKKESSAATVGGSIYSKMRATESKESISGLGW